MIQILKGGAVAWTVLIAVWGAGVIGGLLVWWRVRRWGIVRRRDPERARTAMENLSNAGNQRLRILCLGDSLTDSSYPKRFQRLLGENGVDAKVVKIGFPGHTSLELLSREELFLPACGKADLVILLIGTNDARVDRNHVETEEFALALERLVELLLHRKNPGSAQPLLCLCTLPEVQSVPYHFSPQSNERIARELNPILRLTARQRNLPLVELAQCGGLEWLRPRDVHPTGEGYERIAKLLAEKLAPWLRLLRPPDLDSTGGPPRGGAGVEMGHV